MRRLSTLDGHNGVGGLAKQLTELMKIYNDDGKKFGGELYDVVDYKLQIFFDCCSKVGIPNDQYSHAFSIMLKNRALTFYYDNLAGRGYDFTHMIYETKIHFHTEENHQLYLSEWRETTFLRIIASHPEKLRLDCLQILFDQLQKVQRGLSMNYQGQNILRDQVINACRGVDECNLALYKPADTYEKICAELRSSVGTAMRTRETSQQLGTFNTSSDTQHEHNWTDRTYGGKGKPRGPTGRSRGNFRGLYRGNQGRLDARQKKCCMCQKPCCWSTKHSADERRQAYANFHQHAQDNWKKPSLASFLAQYEGINGLVDDTADLPTDETDQLLLEMSLEEEEEECGSYFTDFGKFNGTQTVAILNDQSTLHAITKQDILFDTNSHSVNGTAFIFEDRYSSGIFRGIMPDSGASGISTAGEPQFNALHDLDSTIQINRQTAGHEIRFGKGTAISLGTIEVPTPLGRITFHVVPTVTPFLLCIQDMDRMGVRLDNLTNTLVQGNKVGPVVRKWGHPWMLLHQSVAWSHLTESELRQLHRRFGHPSVRRLHRVLQRAGNDIEVEVIEKLTK